MFKQIAILVILTIIIILTQHYFSVAALALLHAYQFILGHLGAIFSPGTTGTFFRKLIAFLAIPFLVGLILGGLYWIIRKRKLPGLMPIIWGVWLVLTTLLIIK